MDIPPPEGSFQGYQRVEGNSNKTSSTGSAITSNLYATGGIQTSATGGHSAINSGVVSSGGDIVSTQYHTEDDLLAFAIMEGFTPRREAHPSVSSLSMAARTASAAQPVPAATDVKVTDVKVKQKEMKAQPIERSDEAGLSPTVEKVVQVGIVNKFESEAYRNYNANIYREYRGRIPVTQDTLRRIFFLTYKDTPYHVTRLGESRVMLENDQLIYKPM